MGISGTAGDLKSWLPNKTPWTIQHGKCKGNSRMSVNFKAVGWNVSYKEKGVQRGVKIFVHPGLNFLGEWEHHQGTPWSSENSFIHARVCLPALTAFSLARLRACDMHEVRLLWCWPHTDPCAHGTCIPCNSFHERVTRYPQVSPHTGTKAIILH